MEFLNSITQIGVVQKCMAFFSIIVHSNMAQGYVVGFLVALPVGPLALLCMRRVLSRGFVSGVASAAGGALADSVLAYFSQIGASMVAVMLTSNQQWFKLLGAAFLLYLGLSSMLRKHKQQVIKREFKTLAGDFISVFFLAFVNPITLMAFAVLLASLNIVTQNTATARLIFSIGAFIGSLSWWMVICTLAALLKKKFTTGTLRKVNIISGISIIICALGMLLSALIKH